MNFYLAMCDVDFKNPKDRGLKYEELESLLDGIPARQKLLLLDACNSGENENALITSRTAINSDIAVNTPRFTEQVEAASDEIETFQKMNELFVNVHNKTGSVIIAAAGGMEHALEAIVVNNETIENGAFTYSVLECLRKHKGKELMISELKTFAEKRVIDITNGKQRPTSRQETMEVDWLLK